MGVEAGPPGGLRQHFRPLVAPPAPPATVTLMSGTFVSMDRLGGKEGDIPVKSPDFIRSGRGVGGFWHDLSFITCPGGHNWGPCAQGRGEDLTLGPSRVLEPHQAACGPRRMGRASQALLKGPAPALPQLLPHTPLCRRCSPRFPPPLRLPASLLFSCAPI